nr:hypothetical protein Iba_scaffold2300CG1670 [Ipomoea batatas]
MLSLRVRYVAIFCISPDFRHYDFNQEILFEISRQLVLSDKKSTQKWRNLLMMHCRDGIIM